MTTALDEKEQAKVEAKARTEATAAEEKELNAGLTGKGLRWMVGYTRGRSTQKIKYQAFDTEQPDTLPTSTTEFLDIVGNLSDATLTSYLIDGHNSAMYAVASDPAAAFINPLWSDELQKGFRQNVRSFAANTQSSIEDAVSVIKPGYDAAHAKMAAVKA